VTDKRSLVPHGCRLDRGGRPPRSPTDPGVQISRIRLLGIMDSLREVPGTQVPKWALWWCGVGGFPPDPAPLRAVTNAFTYGLLTGVSDGSTTYASSISYHPREVPGTQVPK
jgi:hypothetical protein